MPTRKTNLKALDAELALTMSNIYAESWRNDHSWVTGKKEYVHVWEDPNFPMTDARRVWKRIRADVLAQWEKKRPGRRPWAWYELDATISMKKGETEETYLRRTGQLTEYEQRLFERERTAKNPR